MGIKIVVLDPTAGCPASAVAVQLVGSFRDPAAVKQIAQLVSSAGHCNSLFGRLGAITAKRSLTTAATTFVFMPEHINMN